MRANSLRKHNMCQVVSTSENSIFVANYALEATNENLNLIYLTKIL